jgi:hypothetical protein
VSIPEFPGQLDEFIKGVPAARISQTSKFGDVGLVGGLLDELVEAFWSPCAALSRRTAQSPSLMSAPPIALNRAYGEATEAS